jgi:alkylation response protein AidB-like acyl-CoA dehydrogenase
MTAETDQATVAPGTGQQEYRDQVRDALSAFDEDTVLSWDERGHLPGEVIAELASRAIFKERWKPGAERGLPHLVALSEETARLSTGLAIAVMGHSEMFTGALMRLGRSAEHLSLLNDALEGRAIGCFAATEPHGGSSLAAIRSTATATAGGWHLRGCKRYVSNLGAATHVLVLARMADSDHADDLGIFLLPTACPGVSVDGFFGTMGARACDVGQVTMDVMLDKDALLGGPGLGMAHALHLLSFERISICAQLLTMAEDSLRLAVCYARQRTAGQSRVFDKQVIRHRLALCQAELWNLQSRLRELTAMAAASARMPSREIAALKLMAGEAAGRIVDACLQVFGARGCTDNFPLERWWRDVRLARFGGGTDEVLADVIASGLDRPDLTSQARLGSLLGADLPRS